MNRIEKIISFIKKEYGLKYDKEVAEKIGTNYNTLKNWVLRDSPNFSVLIDFAERNKIDLNNLFGITNDEFMENQQRNNKNLYGVINLLSEEKQDLLALAIEEAEESDNFLLFDRYLIDFFLKSRFKSEFKVVKVIENFWKELIFDEIKKFSFNKLLEKIILDFNVIETNYDFNEDNAKSKLIELVKSHRRQFMNKSKQQEKDSLIVWIEENICNFDACIILNNIPDALTIFKRVVEK